MTAAGFIFIGTICDIGTWKYSKDVKIFDDEEEQDENTLEVKMKPKKLKDSEVEKKAF